MWKNLCLLSVAVVLVGNVFAGDNTHSGQAVNESARSSGHASRSAAHSVAASGQVTSAAIAVPLLVGGVALSAVGAVSASAGSQSMKAATAPIGTPLKITDESIVTMPPNEALKNKTAR